MGLRLLRGAAGTAGLSRGQNRKWASIDAGIDAGIGADGIFGFLDPRRYLRGYSRTAVVQPCAPRDGVITGASANLQASCVARQSHTRFDAPPFAVGDEVRRRVADRILAAQFDRDLLERFIHFFRAFRKKGAPT